MTTAVFHKERPDAPAGLFACEAAGLRWLSVPGGPRVVDVRRVTSTGLELERLEAAEPTRAAARELGTALARLHDAGADAFGVAPHGWHGDGFFGPLDEPLPLRSGRFQSWGEFTAECRVRPVREMLADRGLLTADLAAALDSVATDLRAGRFDDDEPPARLHGDLWSGNVVWTRSGAVLIDPAAHGGHRLTDLAMLALFGLPFLAEVLGSYQEVHPLRSGWPDLVPLHQVYPVAMHAVLFGGAYARQLGGLVARYV